MLKFIRAQRDIVERILQYIEMSSFSDLLVRIIQVDDQPAGAGVLEVCLHSNQHPLSRETHSHCAYSGSLTNDETRRAPFPDSFHGHACGGG